MAWFLNHYQCDCCDCGWTEEWSCMCDDDCPQCGANMSPYESENLTLVIEAHSGGFTLLRSPKIAEHTPDYYELGTFPTPEKAEGYLADLIKAWGASDQPCAGPIPQRKFWTVR